MRVAIYGRVSAAEQSTVMQVEELRAFCVRRGWDVVEEFTDTGISGSRESRPALNRLLADARRRRFDRPRLPLRPLRPQPQTVG